MSMYASSLRLTMCLNESPSEKEGKSTRKKTGVKMNLSLNESPSEKEGKWVFLLW